MRVRRSDSGIAMVELAFLLFVFGAILFGTIDFARLFYAAIKVADGARAGVQWGMKSHIQSGDDAGMETKAGNNATDISGFSANATRECRCQDGTVVNCTENSCPGGVPQIWIQVQTGKTFETFVSFPGIPGSVDLGQKALVRVQ